MADSELNVLLVEDDEDDYVITRDLLSDIEGKKFNIHWVKSYEEALNEIAEKKHDIYLLDYRLGNKNGLDLLQELQKDRFGKAPAIFLTGQGNDEIDAQALASGAMYYLIKGEVDPKSLDRCIRYCIQQNLVQQSLRRSEGEFRQLSLQLLEAQENERKRVAKELHDSIGQTLTAIKLQIENCAAQLKERKPSPGVLSALITMVQGAVEEVHNICMDLRPPMLDDLGIITTIQWFCREFAQSSPAIKVRHFLDIKETDIRDELKITIFRIIQEAMHNVAKHSGASNLDIVFLKNEKTIDLEVKDNGRGIENLDGAYCQGNTGMGIRNMKERAELSGGAFSIESTVGYGTVVRAFWPSLP